LPALRHVKTNQREEIQRRYALSGEGVECREYSVDGLSTAESAMTEDRFGTKETRRKVQVEDLQVANLKQIQTSNIRTRHHRQRVFHSP